MIFILNIKIKIEKKCVYIEKNGQEMSGGKNAIQNHMLMFSQKFWGVLQLDNAAKIYLVINNAHNYYENFIKIYLKIHTLKLEIIAASVVELIWNW